MASQTGQTAPPSRPTSSCRRSDLVDNGQMHVVLETDRLTLRRFTEEDVDNLFELNSDPEVMRYLTGGQPTPREEIRDNIIPFHLGIYERFDGLGTWAAEARSTGEFLGWFHLRPGRDEDIDDIELGYRLRRAAWNKGYGTEGSRALIRKGFTGLGAERVFAHTMTVNTASRRVMEKSGLVLVRTFPHEGPDVIEGSEHGEVEYALTKTEWETRGPARQGEPPAGELRALKSGAAGAPAGS
jgi:RimJ/RimL family protein N-acetyltransferase